MIEMPAPKFGGTKIGRLALQYAIQEANAGACEIGGNNSGVWVTKYLNGHAPIGSSWCSAFVSWCYQQAAKELGHPGIPYQVAAKGLFNWFKRRGYSRTRMRLPEPGDVIFFWRVSELDWRAHTGIVHSIDKGAVLTIEGNRTSKVDLFVYPYATHKTKDDISEYDDPELKKLIGYGRLPDFPQKTLA